MKAKIQGCLFGLMFIAIGIILALNFSNVLEYSIWGKIYPAFFLICGVSMLIENYKNFIGYIFMAVGIYLFIHINVGWAFDWKFIIVIVAIVIGISIIYTALFGFKRNDGNSQFVLFGGTEKHDFEPEYEGENFTCVFGGADIDLSHHMFTRDIYLNVTSIFGGVDIIVPHDVNIKIKSTPIFGGVSNKTENRNANEYTVYVNALCVFGGVEIKN